MFHHDHAHSGLSGFSTANNPGQLKCKYLTNNPGGAIDGSPVIDAYGTVWVGSMDGTLYAVNPDCSVLCSFQTSGPIESAPAIRDNNGVAPEVVYVYNDNGDFYSVVGDINSGPFLCQPECHVSTLTLGSRTQHIAGPQYSSPVIAADGKTIYVGSSGGNTNNAASATTDGRLYAITDQCAGVPGLSDRRHG